MDLIFKFEEEVIIYGVRVGTGNPSKTHIIDKKTGTSFCGYDNFIAEITIVTSTDEMFKPNFCKKCLNTYEKKHKPIRCETKLQRISKIN